MAGPPHEGPDHKGPDHKGPPHEGPDYKGPPHKGHPNTGRPTTAEPAGRAPGAFRETSRPSGSATAAGEPGRRACGRGQHPLNRATTAALSVIG